MGAAASGRAEYVTTTEEIGRAMLGVAKRGYPKKILESEDFAKV